MQTPMLWLPGIVLFGLLLLGDGTLTLLKKVEVE